MSRTAQLIVGASTDFILTATAVLTGAMAHEGAIIWPAPAIWLLAGLFGLGASAKQVRGMTLDLKPLVVLLALTVAFSGCAATRDIGYAGQHPGYQDVYCKGEVAITGTSTITGSLAYGGAATNSFSLNGKCGDGFSIGRAQGMAGGNTSVSAPPR